MRVTAEAWEPGAEELDASAIEDLLEGHRFDRYEASEAGWFGSKLVKKIGKAAKSVVKQIAKHDPISAAVKAAVTGGNIGKAVLGAARQLGADARAIAPYAATIASAVPGIGTGVAAAIGAGAQLAQGKGLSAALLAGVKSALPGGPVAAAAFDAGMKLAKGGSLTDAAIAATRNVLPGGDVARKAFDAAVAVAHGASLQKAAVDAAISALPGGQFGAAAKALASRVAQGVPVVDAIRSTGSEVALRAASRSLGLTLPTAIRSTADVARSIIARPELHSSTPAQLAAQLGIGAQDARKGLALALSGLRTVGMGKAVRFGGSAAGLEADAGAMMRRIGHRTTFLAAAPQVASYAARNARTPSPTSHLPRRYQRRIPYYAPALEAAGLTSAGTAWLVESGDYPSKIAQTITGSAGRYGELLDANPQKATVRVYKMPDGSTVNVPSSAPTPPNVAAAGVTYMGRNFASLQPGEVLTLPASWVQSTPAPAPAPGPAPSSDPTYASTLPSGAIAAIKAQLGAWGRRYGAIRPVGYPTGLDMTDSMDAPFYEAVASFQRWANSTGWRVRLRADGRLDAPTHEALTASLAKVDPTPAPKVDPTPAPAPAPKVDPTPAPKVDPTPAPAPAPKVDPTRPIPLPENRDPGLTAAQKKDNAESDGGGLALAALGLLMLAA